jgi:uncharacterized protein (DUF4415 family)
MKSKSAKKIFSVRLDAEVVRKVRSMGFTLTEAIEAALRDWLAKMATK